ncbi:MAG: Flp pilus assembly protein CpaB [Ruminiclostridium sp.]|nr:Flp pilus assembly protein CpaB [Ruminiclostridium sp.]
MESVNKKVIFITLILTIVTSLLIYAYISKAATKTEAAVEYADVLVAANTLPSKHIISEIDVKLVKMEKNRVNNKALANRADIVGKRVKESILVDEQIVPERLMDEKKSILSFTMPEGMRALSINISEQSFASYLIRPGDHVDIIASFELESIEEATTITIFPRITKTIIQNLQVLALSQNTVVNEEKISEIPKTVTLAVTPQDAEKLVYASQYATLTLVLRHADDNEIVKTDGVNRKDVASSKGMYTVPKQ